MGGWLAILYIRSWRHHSNSVPRCERSSTFVIFALPPVICHTRAAQHVRRYTGQRNISLYRAYDRGYWREYCRVYPETRRSIVVFKRENRLILWSCQSELSRNEDLQVWAAGLLSLLNFSHGHYDSSAVRWSWSRKYYILTGALFYWQGHVWNPANNISTAANFAFKITLDDSYNVGRDIRDLKKVYGKRKSNLVAYNQWLTRVLCGFRVRWRRLRIVMFLVQTTNF